MPSTREMRLRIKSVKNLSQVTRALKTVSASKVRRAMAANEASLRYSEKAWKVLTHLSGQPGHSSLHPLLNERKTVNNILVVMVSSDQGLAGAYNVNVLRNTLEYFDQGQTPVSYVCVGKKGRDLLLRRKCKVIADFSELKNPVSFLEISSIARLVVDDFLTGMFDQVFISFTRFISMTKQVNEIQKLLPLDVDPEFQKHNQHAVFSYEPEQKELLDEIVPRFTAMQVYQAVLHSQASEHAARMLAMANATDNANELTRALNLEYNKLRQQNITNEMLDIVGGAVAQN